MAKVMISLPDELHERVDSAAAERRTSRSGLLKAPAMPRSETRPTLSDASG